MVLLKPLLTVFIIYKVLYTEAILTTSFPIAGIFNLESRNSSREAFDRIGQLSTYKAYYQRTIYPSVSDSYSTALEVCENTADDKGVTALIDGRPTNGLCDYTCLLCSRLNISHLLVGWEPTASFEKDPFTFAYYPPFELVSKAYAALIKEHLEWDKFSILYEDEGSFIRLQEIINSWPDTRVPITFRRLDPDGDNRESFKHIFKVERLNRHIVECDANNVIRYLNEIMQIENSTQYHSFILTSLDAHTINFKEVPNFNANVTTMHLARVDDVRWKDIGIGDNSEKTMETALAADALTHLEKAIRRMLRGDEDNAEEYVTTPHTFENPPALCLKDSKSDYETIAWPHGIDLRDALLKTGAKGFTGNIEFDEDRRRTNFQLHYSKLNADGIFVYAGSWDSKTDTISKEDKILDRSTEQTKGIIKVVLKIEKPYYYLGKDANGTDVMRGYAIQLINEIFEIINKTPGYALEPEFHLVKDKVMGAPIEGSKMWTGMIGELMDHSADLAICDIGITSQRNSVVDFSTPFMTTGISMLFKERDPEDPDTFSFLNPLTLGVWLCLATTYIIVSFVLLICARMSHDDWVNPHPCNQNPENLQNIWSLYNCMWLTMGTIMTQGCDILPRGIGSRWITGMWWFFALIATASYTANMSTFLSNSRRSTDVTNVKELSEQNTVSYGAVVNSSTYKFFQTSNDTVYQKIWSVMSSARPTVFTKNNDEGRDRVLKSKGKYAFFMESTAINYYTARNCDLRMVGPELDSKEYGIAMPKNFPHKGKVDTAILKLQETGRLAELRELWWIKEDNNIQSCDNKEVEADDSLQMKNSSGIFLVLGMGGILGFFVAIIDFLLHARKVAIREKITYKEALQIEWRTSLNPRALSKPVAPPTRSTPSSPTPSPQHGRSRSRSRAVSVLKAATSFINFDDIY